jgi:hypothetical protein
VMGWRSSYKGIRKCADQNVLIRMLNTTNHKTIKARPLLSYKFTFVKLLNKC